MEPSANRDSDKSTLPKDLQPKDPYGILQMQINNLSIGNIHGNNSKTNPRAQHHETTRGGTPLSTPSLILPPKASINAASTSAAAVGVNHYQGIPKMPLTTHSLSLSHQQGERIISSGVPPPVRSSASGAVFNPNVTAPCSTTSSNTGFPTVTTTSGGGGSAVGVVGGAVGVPVLPTVSSVSATSTNTAVAPTGAIPTTNSITPRSSSTTIGESVGKQVGAPSTSSTYHSNVPQQQQAPTVRAVLPTSAVAGAGGLLGVAMRQQQPAAAAAEHKFRRNTPTSSTRNTNGPTVGISTNATAVDQNPAINLPNVTPAMPPAPLAYHTLMKNASAAPTGSTISSTSSTVNVRSSGTTAGGGKTSISTATSTTTNAGIPSVGRATANVVSKNTASSTTTSTGTSGNGTMGNGISSIKKAPDFTPTTSSTNTNSPAKKQFPKITPNVSLSSGHPDTPSYASDLPSKPSTVAASKKTGVTTPTAATVAGPGGVHVGVVATSGIPSNLNGVSTKNVSSLSAELRGAPLTADPGMQQRLQLGTMPQQQQEQHKQQIMYKQQPLSNNPRLAGAPTVTTGPASAVPGTLEGLNGPSHRSPAGPMQHGKSYNGRVIQTQQARLRPQPPRPTSMVPDRGPPLLPSQRVNTRTIQPSNASQRVQQQEERTAAAPVKELKVEDALLYLDQVKEAFGDRPRIYNEFLEIMKNFKSQQIDTPGVIKRVSNLFYGYNNLILGFNTFLPEGYKIELRDLEQQQQQQQQDVDHNRLHQPQPQPPPPQQPQQQPPPPKSIGRGKPQQIGPTPQGAYLVAGGPPGQVGHVMAGAPHGHGRVAIQAKQHPQQQQLPKPQTTTQMRQTAPMGMQQQQFQRAAPPPMSAPPQPTVGTLPGSRVGPPLGFQPLPQSGQPGTSQMRTSHGPIAGQGVAPTQQPQPQPPTQAVEFDHAISYVTTIKKRFEKDPQIYQQFLEILHTYQKEQRGIKEVLEQVSSLFANHPDLLKEFTYFLPDAVQEQAKERLHRAVLESEARLQMRAAAARHHQEVSTSLPHPVLSSKVGAVESAPLQVQQPHTQAQQQQQQQLQPQSVEQPSAPKQQNQKPPDVLAVESKQVPKLISQKEPIAEKEVTTEISVPSRTVPITTPSAPVASFTRPHPPQPETFVYNTAVERQFFDTLKEVLTNNSRDGVGAWQDFVKFLDLYGQEVLSRVELLTYVEELLGKRHADLFDEFKRVLAAAGSPTAMNDDTWFSVPLSEIDFTRCRKCTPSYRALPRNYPLPPCSDRLDLETSVLNDVWVSLPVGSEESYTFRHMRRNQQEETLFRVEDERFEIDMVIDSNATTLRRLEPIAEEISLLSRKERSPTSMTESTISDAKNPSSLNRPALTKKFLGAGGKKFQYVLDKKILTTIHLYSIMRIYGDFGHTMIKLLFSNPTKTVPIVVKRLRQKDIEWREARNVLNRRWKELVDQNYFKCFDHRSLTWRTLDKRATSTRTLLAEIRDRAANNGMESESSLATKREKAKEEYGTFYEISMGRSLRQSFDLSNYPKPVSSIFTPHLSVVYENISWAHLDAYRVLVFALEKGSTISPLDKDRGHRLLRDFIGPLFGISYSSLFGSGVGNTSLMNDRKIHPACSDDGKQHEDAIMEEDACEKSESAAENETTSSYMPQSCTKNCVIIDQQPVGNGTTVATVFGEGTLLSYRSEDNLFVIRLAYGLSYLNPNAIICTLQPASQSSLTDELRAEDLEELPKGDLLFMGNQSVYLFLRLHDVLVKRLNVAKKIAYEVSERGEMFSSVETIMCGPSEDVLQDGRKRYESYLSLLYSLLEGGATAAEGDKYEDRLRLLLGHYAFELSTMDKLVSHLLKHLQSMGGDEMLNSLIQLYKRHLGAGSFRPTAFRQEAAILSEGEMIYAFQYCRVPNSDKSIMHYEYLGCLSDTDDEEDSVTGDEDRDVGSVDDMVNDTDGEGNNISHPSAKRQRR